MELTSGKLAAARLALGVGQMSGATAGFILLFERGVTPLSLGVMVGTSLLTTLSLLLFGRRRGP